MISGVGLECVITLGTGFGFAVFTNGLLGPHMEVGQHPIAKGLTYDHYLDNAALHEVGRKKWNKRLQKAIAILDTLIMYDTLLIGGGNAQVIDFDLPANVKIVPNAAGITGGVRLWEPRMDEAFTRTRADGAACAGRRGAGAGLAVAQADRSPGGGRRLHPGDPEIGLHHAAVFRQDRARPLQGHAARPQTHSRNRTPATPPAHSAPPSSTAHRRARRSAMMPNISRTISGARPRLGSSSISRSGEPISARPIASICRSPPDSVPAS